MAIDKKEFHEAVWSYKNGDKNKENDVVKYLYQMASIVLSSLKANDDDLRQEVVSKAWMKIPKVKPDPPCFSMFWITMRRDAFKMLNKRNKIHGRESSFTGMLYEPRISDNWNCAGMIIEKLDVDMSMVNPALIRSIESATAKDVINDPYESYVLQSQIMQASSANRFRNGVSIPSYVISAFNVVHSAGSNGIEISELLKTCSPDSPYARDKEKILVKNLQRFCRDNGYHLIRINNSLAIE